jgi:putative transposase
MEWHALSLRGRTPALLLISVKSEINLQPSNMPSELKEAIGVFVTYYNFQRYHEGLGNVTPHDVFTGRHLTTIAKRKEVKSKTSQDRRDYDNTIRKG